MQLKDVLTKDSFKLVSTNADLNEEIHGAYCGDLLSWVMGRGQPEQAWITVQSHINVIAVASLREFSCIVLADGAQWPEEVIAKANAEEITLLQSDLPVFETAKLLIEMGI